MSESRPRVVLDTVIFVQYLLSARGAAAGCVDEMLADRFIPLTSDRTLSELHDVPSRPAFIAKYPFVTPAKVARLITELESRAVRIPTPPRAFELPRDSKDEPFVDLAVTGQAQFIVTWNQRHLTYLMNQDTSEGIEFCRRFPSLKIVSPPAFLAAVRPTAS